MTIFRPSAIHQILHRHNICSAVNHSINESNMKCANFAWKYWRRENSHFSSCWNQLRPYHQYTAVFQINGPSDNGSNTKHLMNHSGFSRKAFTSPPSILSLPYTSHMTLMPTRLEDTTMKIYVRSMSRKVDRSKVDFSTLGAMPHSTCSTSSKDEHKEKDEKAIESLPASQKAKILFKKYGSVFVGTYFGIYFSTLFAFFVTLDFGLLDPETVSEVFKVSKNLACETGDLIGPPGTGHSMNEAADAYASEVTTEISNDKRTLVDIITGYLQNWEWTSKYADKLSENPHLANLAVAWFIVKLTEPVRLAAAIIATPKVAKALGRKEVKIGVEKNV